jgi:hypothetical protein
VYTDEVRSTEADELLPGYEQSHDDDWFKWFGLSFLEPHQAHLDLLNTFSKGGNRVTRVEKIETHHVWIIRFEMGTQLRSLAKAAASRRIRGILRKAFPFGPRDVSVSFVGKSALMSFVWRSGVGGALAMGLDGRFSLLLPTEFSGPVAAEA